MPRDRRGALCRNIPACLIAAAARGVAAMARVAALSFMVFLCYFMCCNVVARALSIITFAFARAFGLAPRARYKPCIELKLQRCCARRTVCASVSL